MVSSHFLELRSLGVKTLKFKKIHSKILKFKNLIGGC